MCRWMAYTGGSIRLQELLFEPKDNLIDQSLSSRSAETPTNGDGFGVGWYSKWERPGLFHSIRSAWNDSNLRDLAANIESHLFMAHVRATSLWGFRYASDNNAPTLFHSHEVSELEKINPKIKDRLSDTALIIVSEPIGKFKEMWAEVPQSSTVIIQNGNVEIKPFKSITA